MLSIVADTDDENYTLRKAEHGERLEVSGRQARCVDKPFETRGSKRTAPQG